MKALQLCGCELDDAKVGLEMREEAKSVKVKAG